MAQVLVRLFNSILFTSYSCYLCIHSLSDELSSTMLSGMALKLPVRDGLALAGVRVYPLSILPKARNS